MAVISIQNPYCNSSSLHPHLNHVICICWSTFHATKRNLASKIFMQYVDQDRVHSDKIKRSTRPYFEMIDKKIETWENQKSPSRQQRSKGKSPKTLRYWYWTIKLLKATKTTRNQTPSYLTIKSESLSDCFRSLSGPFPARSWYTYSPKCIIELFYFSYQNNGPKFCRPVNREIQLQLSW